MGDVTIAADAAVSGKLRCSLVSDGVLVEGELAAPWRGPCSRCALDVDGTAAVSVRERFVVGQSDPTAVASTRGDQYLLETRHLNLTAMMRDALLLELPTAGAQCPNGDDCEHLPDELKHRPPPDPAGPPDPSDATEARDPRWAALDVLRER